MNLILEIWVAAYASRYEQIEMVAFNYGTNLNSERKT